MKLLTTFSRKEDELESAVRKSLRVLPLSTLEQLTHELQHSKDPQVIETCLRRIVEVHGVVNGFFNYSSAIWRGRKCTDAGGFSTVREVGCPPSALTPAGRLNEPGNPLLYTSINKFSVLAEVGAIEGDFVHLLAYSLEDRSLRVAFVGDAVHVHRWAKGRLSDAAGREINRLLNASDPAAGKSLIYADALLSSLLADAEAGRDSYVRSRTVARLMFERVPQIDGIIYPGIAVEGSMNIAIRPDAAVKALRNVATGVVRVDRKYAFGLYDFTVVRWAEGHWADGTIRWGSVPTVNQKPPAG